MNLIAVFLILAALVGLSFFRLPTLLWLIIWPLAVYLFLVWGITVPVPSSVVNLYLGLTFLALLVYALADKGRYETMRDQILAFVTEERYSRALRITIAVPPLLLAAKIYSDTQVQVRAPSFARTIHPAPPASINFKGKEIDLIRGKNPYRVLESENPEEYQKHVQNGKRVYYNNCVFCHGDDLRGDGMFAHGLSPLPANFNSATTIGMLQEAYLFWRIAKGGPGLPDESGPWSSSMPAWEKFLEEDEIWDVILYLYEHTGLHPRAEEEQH